MFAGNLGLSPSIASQFTLLQLKSIFLGFKVINFKDIDVDIPKKLVTSACYDKQHVCAYLQPSTCWTSQQRINNHFLEGYPFLTLECVAGLGLLKSTFSAEIFIYRLSWSISSHFGAFHS